ncbi:MAG: hypothetical protein AAAB35_20070, partial [Phyllobacterium sp.]
MIRQSYERALVCLRGAGRKPHHAGSPTANWPDASALRQVRPSRDILRKLLLQSVASIALVCLANVRAYADCVETPSGSGTFECTGQINGGFTSTGASVTVNADSTAAFNADVSITGPGTSTLTNYGTLTNSLRATDNDSFRLDNHGLIDGTIFLGGVGTNLIVNFNDGDVQNGVTSTGTSNDTVLNNGFFAGSISLGDGNDILGLIAGTVQTTVDMGAGDDQFTWLVGNVAATVQLGSGNDLAQFGFLTQANLTAGKIVDGGPGTDRLVWERTTNDDGSGAGDHPSNLVNWEDISLINQSRMNFIYTTGVLTLGDSATGTGTLSIDSTSSIGAGNSYGYGIVPYNASQLVTVNNAGAIDMTNDIPGSGTSLHDTFTIHGNYIGQGGQLLLHTYLDTDGSPSDRLIIESGQGSGATNILITNVDGPGALTAGNGILVVDATSGATTTTDAFALGGIVAAGPYEYLLFRSGVTASADTDDDWFLRNTVSPPPPPPPPP